LPFSCAQPAFLAYAGKERAAARAAVDNTARSFVCFFIIIILSF
jgi:hypothetical protein